MFFNFFHFERVFTGINDIQETGIGISKKDPSYSYQECLNKENQTAFITKTSNFSSKTKF